MEERNHSSVTSFILLGLTSDTRLQLLLFMVFTFAYITTLLCNITLIVMICHSSRLHTPMDFFTGNLSFLDLWYSCVYTSKILLNCISEDKSTSFAGCAAQFFVSSGLACTESYLLAAMAYDRYVAISNPLLHAAAMTKKLCIGLVATSYLSGFANSTLIASYMFTPSFCDSNVIDDFFCDLLPLVKLSCDVTDSYQSLLYFILTFNTILPSALILRSYVSISVVILRMCSTEGQCKSFSTSATHLTTITLSYGSILFIYTQPSSSYVLERHKVVSALYMVVTPMLNPFIYSLRSQEVKEALKTLLKRQTAS
ncbi:olfactory receptor 1013-like [Pezoporus wallicus]|uniref:olfactory receptor 1013-like n=1 Tax=Pezoporus wallicus TaxID=35540 RepID=UPI00254A8E57|nr:olfactory receptor 1013-like [Pezoporus wallicus]